MPLEKKVDNTSCFTLDDPNLASTSSLEPNFLLPLSTAIASPSSAFIPIGSTPSSSNFTAPSSSGLCNLNDYTTPTSTLNYPFHVFSSAQIISAVFFTYYI